MSATPPLPPPLASPAGFLERRRLPDRRHAERRGASATPWAGCRRSGDRRHPVARRETGLGHLRNALQTLTFLKLTQADDADRQALRAVADRLWLALFEIQRQGR